MKMKTRFVIVLATLSIMVCSISGKAQDSIEPPVPVPMEDLVEAPALDPEPEIFEEPEPDEEPPVIENPEALTPEGNLSLVDDLETADEDKQFLTVVSKNGNYFYVIVDRSLEGENNVHFLNQVDEADLMALTEDGADVTEAVCVCDDKCVPGEVNSYCAVCTIDLADCRGKAPEPTPIPSAEPEPEPEKSSGTGAIALALILVLGGGGAFCYFKILKNKPKQGGSSDLDEYDFGDDDDEDDYDVEDEYEDDDDYEDEQLEDEELEYNQY